MLGTARASDFLIIMPSRGLDDVPICFKISVKALDDFDNSFIIFDDLMIYLSGSYNCKSLCRVLLQELLQLLKLLMYTL